MFATVWHDKHEVNLRLSPSEQRKFLSIDGEGFVEIDNAWGRQGWTKVQLQYTEPEDFKAALLSAWKHSQVKAPKAKAAKPKKRAK